MTVYNLENILYLTVGIGLTLWIIRKIVLYLDRR